MSQPLPLVAFSSQSRRKNNGADDKPAAVQSTTESAPLAPSKKPASVENPTQPGTPGPALRPGAAAKPNQKPDPETGPKPGPPAGKAPGQPQSPKPGQGAAANPAPTRPPVKKSFLRPRHLLIALSFVLCVLLPSAVSGIYLWAFAADQYVSKVGFSVRREDNASAVDLLGGLSTLSNSSSTDTDILYEFIQSQRLVIDIDAELGLREIWSRPEGDPIFTLPQDASVEQLVDYWNDMVRLSYGAGSGLLEVEARAFTAQEATLITQTLFAHSSDMINELSAIAREDAIAYAREELDAAQDRLRDARARVTQFRNENQLINPEIDLQSQAGLLSTLQAQQAETLIEIDILRVTSRSGDPRLQQAERRLEVIEKRISAERQKLGFQGLGPGKAFSEIVGEYERLVVDREFGERAYVSALATYDAAVAEARRKTRYLAAYVEPTQAETPQHPRRLTLLALISLFMFMIWSIAVLVIYSIKDRR